MSSNRKTFLTAAAGGLAAATVLPNSVDAATGGTYSVTMNSPEYSHTLSWPATSDPSGIKPQGNVYTHSQQLVTNASHSFRVNSDKSITHSHSFSNAKLLKSFTQTEPYMNGKAGSYRTAFGAIITVTAPGHGYATMTVGGVNYRLQADTTELILQQRHWYQTTVFQYRNNILWTRQQQPLSLALDPTFDSNSIPGHCRP